MKAINEARNDENIDNLISQARDDSKIDELISQARDDPTIDELISQVRVDAKIVELAREARFDQNFQVNWIYPDLKTKRKKIGKKGKQIDLKIGF